jgi:hypothetical protein
MISARSVLESKEKTLNTRLQCIRHLSFAPIALVATLWLFGSIAGLAQANAQGVPAANPAYPGSSSNSVQESCQRLLTLALPHITIMAAHIEAAGPVKATQGPPIQAPARCVVQAISRPTSDSDITIEVWLPTQGWNKRYQQTGNGGWAGAIQAANLAYATQRGYAAASTDNGHQGGITDASFVVGHPEKLVDFGYRALRETAETAKALIEAFYGQKPAHSYFNGCSDGGREALMEAQRYPEDFDGILAGAPANDWSHMSASHVWDTEALTSSVGSAIPPAKLPAIHAAVLAACDAKDGLRDGLISDPRACHFNPAILTCKGADGSECLTKSQVEALAKIYAGPRNPVTGAQEFPGYEPGTETAPNSWAGWIIADVPEHSMEYGFGITYYKDAVFEHTPWSLQTMDFDKDVALADQKVGAIIDSTNTDLRSFRDHGGKLIQYHGWGDAAIAPMSSIDYYEQVGAFLAKYPDPRAAKPQSESDFYRLFMVPGLGHCSSGVGPVNFGQIESTGTEGRGDPERDILAALVQWVETGVAPERLIGVGPAPGDPSKQLSRPFYPYPAITHYNGQGDPNDAASFSGVKP